MIPWQLFCDFETACVCFDFYQILPTCSRMGKSLTLDNLTWTTVQHILTLFFSLVCTVGPRKDIAGGSGQVGLKSTCHLALNECERDNSCSRYLDQGVYLCQLGQKVFTSLNLFMLSYALFWDSIFDFMKFWDENLLLFTSFNGQTEKKPVLDQ